MIAQGCKRTEVGVIPEDWDVGEIGTHTSIKTGAKNTQDRKDDGEYPFFVRSQTVEQIDSYSFDGEAVLTAGDGVGTGKVYHYIKGRFDVHQRVYRITNFDDQLDSRYFFYQFSTRFYDRIMSMTAKSSVDSVRMDMIAKMPIPLPKRPEQRAIAAALSDVDELIGALDKLIAKKRAIKLAAMQQLLTGKIRLPGFDGEWTTKLLGDFTSIRNEKVVPSKVAPDTPCVELEHIGQGDGRLLSWSTARYSTSSKYRFFRGDVLFGRLRSYLRKHWQADRDGICTTEIWPLKVNSEAAISGFLRAIVETDSFIDAASISYGTHMPRADWGVMRNFEVCLPPLPEQQAIATMLADMDAEISAIERRRDKTKAIKQGMMQALLTGRVRLVQPEVTP
jgi:type I restriction enzyme S subunit